MTSALKLSIIGNLSLLAILAWLSTRPAPLSATKSTAVPAQTQTRPNDAQPIPIGRAFGGFSWRQIESLDYPTYVTNLRQIGCPEQTIADVIRADVHSLYTKKRAELGLAGSSSGSWSSTEESQVINTLLGYNAGETADRFEATDPVPMLPLVFHDAALTSLHLDAEQQAAVNELRAQFDSEIGGTNQDPADPTYAHRWRRAQPESDRLLRGMIGVNAFMQLQNQGE